MHALTTATDTLRVVTRQPAPKLGEQSHGSITYGIGLDDSDQVYVALLANAREQCPNLVYGDFSCRN